ncbi:MAG: tetratricopeptide repeat protein [Candidatus Longimicrobiales bacterium M2_2A_002]
MLTSSRKHRQLFAELKRRKVFRVIAVYGAVAFGVIQVVDPVSSAYGLPDWFLPSVVTLLLAGFPVAVVLAWALEVTPDGVRRTDSAEPREIDRILDQSRAKRWLPGILALAGVAALVTGAWLAGRHSGAAAEGATAEGRAMDASIAVLPFANMSPDPDQVYFAEGISEELLNLLAGIPELRVAARTSSFAFRDANLEITRIGDSLNVAHVLEGSVRKSGDQVRVTAQLVRSDDGFHVWSETWDRSLDDIFAIQDEIAADVVDQLRVTLLDETRPRVQTTDPEAYRLYLQARYVTELGTREAALRAEELYGEALEIDPEYAPAWVGLASIRYNLAGPIGFAYDSMAPLAVSAAQQALEVDPDNARAHSMLGTMAKIEGDFATAAHYHQEALELDPGDAQIVGSVGIMLLDLGRLDDAVRAMEYRVERDPVSLSARSNLGLIYMAVHRYEDAVEQLRTALDLNANAVAVPSLLAMNLTFLDRAGQAQEVLADEPMEFWRLIGQVHVYHALNRTDESDAALAELMARHEEDAAFNIAYALAYRGEVDRAFEWLDKAVEYEDPGLSEIFVYPQFDALKHDPRWKDLLDRLDKSPEDLAAIEFEVDLPGRAEPGVDRLR